MKIGVSASDFKTKKAMFDFLVKNKSEMIDLKLASRKEVDGHVIHPKKFDKESPTLIKAVAYENAEGHLLRTIVANTYNWMDGHDDVHLNNLFSKSISERATKIPHLVDHKFSITDGLIGKTQSIEETEMNWKDLGVDRVGSTMVLLAVSKIIETYNKKTFDLYQSDEIDQHSVAMGYIRINLAVNDEDYKDEYKNWQSTFDKLGNPDKAIDRGFFWAVSEAKLFEYSAVLAGSNELTPTLNNNKFLPSKDTGKEASEPPKRTPMDIDKLVQHYKI